MATSIRLAEIATVGALLQKSASDEALRRRALACPCSSMVRSIPRTSPAVAESKLGKECAAFLPVRFLSIVFLHMPLRA